MNFLANLYASLSNFSSYVILTASEAVESESGNPIVKMIIIALVVGLLVGGIYALMLKGELTSVYSNDSAADYKKAGSFKVDLSREMFMYSKTEKREKPQQNAETAQKK